MGYGSTLWLCLILGLGAAVFTGSRWIWPVLIGAVLIAAGSVLFRSKHYELFRDLKSAAQPAQKSGYIILTYILLAAVQNTVFAMIAAGAGFLLKKLW